MSRGIVAAPTGTEVMVMAQQADVEVEETDRLVMLVPKSLKRQLKLIARDLEDLGESPATITRVAVDILQDGIDKYERAVKKRLAGS